MLDRIEQIRTTFRKAVWELDVTTLSPLRAAYIRLLRIVYTILHELADGQLNLRAMSLVYTTLLAVVPLLAVSFSVLKAFGVHNQLEELLLRVLAPLGDKGFELTMRILDFVDNVKVGVLGSLGLALLFYTVVSMVQKVERAFNYTWRVAQPRSVTERVTDYVSVLIIGPVCMFTALGITATITGTSLFKEIVAIEAFGFGLRLATQAVPHVLVIVAFMFVYMFIPNTKVQIKAALVGGIVAGVLWESTGWGFAAVVVGTTQYTAIYSSFAIVILLMIWIYLSWLILLVGASVAFYYQHPEYLGVQHELRFSNRLRERIALQTIYLIARHYYKNLPGWTPDTLAKRFDVPVEPLGRIFRALEAGGILVQARGEPPNYLPARDLDTVRVKEILDLVRTAEERTQLHYDRIQSEPVIDRLMTQLDQSVEATLGDTTVKDLAMSEAAPPSGVNDDVEPEPRASGDVLREAGSDTSTPG